MPGQSEMTMLAAKGFFDNTKNFTATIDMFNRNAETRKSPIIRPFIGGQDVPFRRFNRDRTRRMESLDPLIPRIRIHVDLRCEWQARLLKQAEIMRSPQATDHDQNLYAEVVVISVKWIWRND